MLTGINGGFRAVWIAALVLGTQAAGIAGSLLSPYNSPVYYISSQTGSCGGNCRVVLTTAGTASTSLGQATAGLSPSPYVDISGTVDSTNPDFERASLKYYFEYVGPVGTSILVDTSYLMSNSGADYTGFLASVKLLDSGSNGIEYQCIGNESGCPGAGQGTYSYPGTFTDSLLANQVYELDLYVEFSYAQVEPRLPVHITADSVISIDPGFTGDPSAYTLLLSDGVGNSTAATPEPASLVFVVSGIGGIMALRRRGLFRTGPVPPSLR